MRARTSLGFGLQKLPPRTEAGRSAARALAEHDQKRYSNVSKTMQMVDFSELEIRTLASLGITAEDIFRD